MLKPYTETFLDGNNLDYVRVKTGKKFFVTQNNYSIAEVIDLIKKNIK